MSTKTTQISDLASPNPTSRLKAIYELRDMANRGDINLAVLAEDLLFHNNPEFRKSMLSIISKVDFTKRTDTIRILTCLASVADQDQDPKLRSIAIQRMKKIIDATNCFDDTVQEVSDLDKSALIACNLFRFIVFNKGDAVVHVAEDILSIPLLTSIILNDSNLNIRKGAIAVICNSLSRNPESIHLPELLNLLVQAVEMVEGDSRCIRKVVDTFPIGHPQLEKIFKLYMESMEDTPGNLSDKNRQILATLAHEKRVADAFPTLTLTATTARLKGKTTPYPIVKLEKEKKPTKSKTR